MAPAARLSAAFRKGTLRSHCAKVPPRSKARLWTVATQREIGTPMTVGRATALAFSPDGTTLTVAGDGTARRWDVRFPAGLLTAACAVAGQSLTRQQGADYAGTQPFQQVCP